MKHETAVQRLLRESSAAHHQDDKYEQACLRVPPGTLSAQDILRLWGSREPLFTKEGVGAKARRVVAEQNLPLMEVGDGKWQVCHSL